MKVLLLTFAYLGGVEVYYNHIAVCLCITHIVRTSTSEMYYYTNIIVWVYHYNDPYCMHYCCHDMYHLVTVHFN